MSNGYLLVAEADREAAYALGDGFDLDVIGATTLGDHEATAAALTGASNVGLVLSNAAIGDAAFVALLHTLAQRVGVAQLIVVEPEARAAFGFLPEAWPIMPFATALERATELVRRRDASAGASEPPHAAPLPPTPPPVEEAPPAPIEEPPAPAVAEEPPAPSNEAQPSASWSQAPTDIFLSYSRRADGAHAERLVAKLRERGLSVWLDTDSMPGGGDFQGAVREAINNANKVVVLWSSESVSNEHVVREAREAATRDALISITIDGAAPPAEFAAFQTITLSDDAAGAVVARINGQEPPPFQTEAPPPAQELERGITLPDDVSEAPADEGATSDDDTALLGGVAPEEPSEAEPSDSFGAGTVVGAPAPVQAEPPAPPPVEELPEAPPPIMPAPAPSIPAPQAPSSAAEPPRSEEPPPAPRKKEAARSAPPPAETAPADATAFAPKKVRRGTPELVRIAIHQPKDLKAVIKAARQVDPSTTPAPQGMSIGDVAIGAHVGVSLEVRGAACEGAVQRRIWRGDPIDFNFSIEADSDVKQIVVLARVFVDDAQIGVLAFTRPVIGADKKAQGDGDKIRLKRHKRVFLSYSSKDRETVSAIATAYASAGVEHFWDRTSLKSGEEWSPRLRKEIERADLFHLCWSKSAAASEWVEKEASHALARRRRSKKPEITVQMLDGPPWAKHPDSLDSINFDDFVRAAIVGYARGDGET